MTEEQKLAYPEVILVSAVRYAMCVDEPLPTEAAVAVLREKIPDLSDAGLWEVMKAVRAYLKYPFDDAWTGIFEELEQEYAVRKSRRGG